MSAKLSIWKVVSTWHVITCQLLKTSDELCSKKHSKDGLRQLECCIMQDCECFKLSENPEPLQTHFLKRVAGIKQCNWAYVSKSYPWFSIQVSWQADSGVLAGSLEYLQSFRLGKGRRTRIQKLLLVDANLLHVILQQLLHLRKQSSSQQSILTSQQYETTTDWCWWGNAWH